MSPSQSRLNELATVIKENTKIVSSYYESHGLPPPSFDIDGPSTISIPFEEASVRAAHIAVLGATLELHYLVLGPKEVLMNEERLDSLSLHGIYRFQFEKTFPIDSEATFEEIAKAAGLNVVDTRRILRHAMTKGIFREPRPGVVAHTAASRLLAEDSAVRDFVGAAVEEAMPAYSRTIDAISKWGYAKDASQSGFSLAHNTKKSLYDVLHDEPERGKRWANAMSTISTVTSIHVDAILQTFDWESLGSELVVDVGGGHGNMSIGIASQTTKPRFLVQDLPHVAEQGPSHVPAKLKDRVTFMPYDARTPQPIKGAAVYFFQAVFHNWPDAVCVEILRNQVAALKPGSKIIIHDAVMHEPGELPMYMDKQRRTMDLNMLGLFGARERTQQDWEDLLKEADSRLETRVAPQVPGEFFKMIEATFKG